MIPITQEKYFNDWEYAEEVEKFSGKSLQYWNNLMTKWEAEHPQGTDALITEVRDYTHDELLNLYNHEVQNAYGYSKLVHKVMTIDAHLNSPHRTWMPKIYEVYEPGKRILDFGCGDLTNACCFYDMGYKTTVADLPINWIKFIEWRCQKYNIDIDFRYTYTNDSFLIPNEQFDVIFSHEVLEHVKEPEKVLAYLVEHLKIGGILFVTVCFTSGSSGFHLEENHRKFSINGEVQHSPNWMKVLTDLNLTPIGNDFYIKEKQLEV